VAPLSAYTLWRSGARGRRSRYNARAGWLRMDLRLLRGGPARTNTRKFRC